MWRGARNHLNRGRSLYLTFRAAASGPREASQPALREAGLAPTLFDRLAADEALRHRDPG